MVTNELGFASLILAAVCLLSDNSLIGQNSVAVEVEESGQAAYQAELIELRASGVKLRQGGQLRELKFEQLLKIKINGRRQPQRTAPVTVVELRDGSRLTANQVATDGHNLICDVAGRKLQFDIKQVSTLLLKKLSVEQAKQWADMLESGVTADTLILARAEDALDKIEGAVAKISTETVTFDFDGRQVDVPVAKLAGIRFFAAASDAPAKLLATITDAQQNRWMVSAFNTLEGKTQLKLRCGASVELSLSGPLEIDFSTGNTLYLASLEALDRSSEPRLDLGIALPESAKMFGPRPVGSAASGNLLTDIEFVGAGAITYRIPDGFTKLKGAIELSPTGKQFTPCRVAVMLENKLLWEYLFQSPRQPQSIDLVVEGDRRLKLVVESKASPPIGDVVQWKQLRLMK